ncbi:breast cancer type 2 susceptibility protein [Cololabis saira]|uniref:breast cancer type 2 susceptibility protein n=1 Tax=Cololabis saira TaxID=129043 RepID=UPI002AD33040|nr:breast cancer type 2 susceptibility protein [Cololabis saira]
MESPPNNMYDAFKDQIWTELGPLDPNWFEILSGQTSVHEVSDQDDLCDNQEANFKTPFEKADGSQLFSTPKVFRHSRIVSPEIEDEQSFTAAQEKATLPCTATQSPSLFKLSKERVAGGKCRDIQTRNEDSFDLLHTPNKSPVSYVKHISESLGAQLNPDVSWTSSLNTPPAVPSTLILSKTDEEPCPPSATPDRNFVIVRELFPSLSKGSTGDAPENNNVADVSQGAVSTEAHDRSHGTLNESAWQQKVPDAIEDGEVRSTVAEVINGAENVLSIFFANSSSALRKVKHERLKRKQNIQIKETDCSSAVAPSACKAAAAEEEAIDAESDRFPSSPLVKTGHGAISQWSPLSLSEIQSCTENSTILKERLQGEANSSPLSWPSGRITDSGFIRKKRLFVDSVRTLKSKEEKDCQFQKMALLSGIPESINTSLMPGQEMNGKHLEKLQPEADFCGTGNSELKKGSEEAKVQDLDISQLSRDFAQDFSQMSDCIQQSKVAEDTFSTSACLSALKQAREKERQATLQHNMDGNNRKHISTFDQSYHISEGIINDSGFQSAVTNTTHLTATPLGPCSENTGQSQQSSGFKTDIHTASPFPSTKGGNGKSHLDAEAGTTLPSVQRNIPHWTLDPRREGKSDANRRSTGQPSGAKRVDNMNCKPLNGQFHDVLQDKMEVSVPSANASGFKTASNKGIRISTANLERAKHLFEETEGKKTFNNLSTKCDSATKYKNNISDGSVQSVSSNSNPLPSLCKTFGNFSSQLTASQKADVTELCSLLEEAESQFDITQSKPPKLQQHCQSNGATPRKAAKELDSDFLAGINFDDSFSSDAEKQEKQSAKPDKMDSVLDDKANIGTLNTTAQSTDWPLSYAPMKENSSASLCLKSTSEDTRYHSSAKPKNRDSAEYGEATKVQNTNTFVLGVGFKTAGGNLLNVSKKSLSKARALFADLDKNPPDEESTDKQNSEIDAKMDQKCNLDRKDIIFTPQENSNGGEGTSKDGNVDTNTCQSGFHMASGKQIPISANYMEQADAFFKDRVIMESNDGMSDKNIKHVPDRSENKKNHSEGHVNGCTKFESGNPGLVARNTKRPHLDEVGSKVTHALQNAVPFHGKQILPSKPSSSVLRTTSKDIDLSATDEMITGCGFRTASGKDVSVTADALKRAECLLKEIHTPEAINDQPNQKETSKSGQLNDRVLQPEKSGFQTASGKVVGVSLAALKKAETLMKECAGVEGEINPPLLHHKIPVTGSHRGNWGFSAASGKPVAVSSEALQKAKALFSDIGKTSPAVPDTRTKTKNEDARDNMETVQRGFTTASGAKAHVSRKNLLKANHRLKEFDDLVLTKAMQEEDAFFREFDMDADDAMLPEDVSSVGGSKKKIPAKLDPDQREAPTISKEAAGDSVKDVDEQAQQKGDILTPEKSGCQTGSGKAIGYLSPPPTKTSGEASNSLLNPCEGVEDKKGATTSRSKLTSLPFNGGGFCAASGKPVAVSSEALQKAKSLFTDLGHIADLPDISQKRKSDGNQDNGGNTVGMRCGFTTAGGVKVHVSKKSLMKAKHLLKEYEDADDLKDGTMDSDGNNSGRCKSTENISGRHHVKQSLSKSNQHQREMADFPKEHEHGSTEYSDKPMKQKEITVPQKGGGFQTASGNVVAISSEALKRAKILLSDCEEASSSHFKLPVTDPVSKSCGFSAASGKPVVFSSEALQKAKTLFGDISLSKDTAAISDTKKRDEKCEEAEKNRGQIHCGFSTAAGQKVLVSEKSLLKANDLLKESDDGECHYSFSNSTTSQDTHKSDSSKGKYLNRTLNSTVTPDDGKGNPPERETSLNDEPFSALKQSDHLNKTVVSSSIQGCSFIKEKTRCTSVFKFQEDKVVTSGAGSLTDIPEQDVPRVLNCNINQTSRKNPSGVAKADESSVLNLQSLDLSGCTVTQQKFLAQEALDCTKALLEDEDVAGQSLTLENMPSSGSTEEQRTRKRVMGDPDHIGQPPSKRRLLEEFDRTINGSRGSVLHPVKSSPIGLMKDRGVFRYGGSLHPNITKPFSERKSNVTTVFQKTPLAQQSTPGDCRSASSKVPAFVPPFIKSAKMETGKNPAPKENASVSTFVPPFKKQKTILQESFSKQQDHQPLTGQPNSNTYVPPTRKIQDTTDVISSVGMANTNTVNNQSVPVTCGSASSGADVSHVDATSSRNQDVPDDPENIELARDMQDMRIRKKKRQTIRPLPGSLFLTKTSGVARTPLKVGVNGNPPRRYTPEQLYAYGVHKHATEITSETAESFRFNLLQFIKHEAFLDGGGVQLADGGWLIPSNDCTAGKEEFYRALCDTPGVDPKLISEAWVYNHYRWIVWKQASMERSFPETMGSICLTPEQVLLQLKYRYDVEVDHSRRSALKKIMEKDDTAAKSLVLCVCETLSRGQPQSRQSNNGAKTPQSADSKVENPYAVVGLTDGWYAIKAQLDEPLTAMLEKGLLAVGGKLIIHGAQLTGSQDACPPLEAPESLMLKICANSSRRVRWDAKLGFHRDPRPFLLPVSSLYSTGGPVGCVDIVIVRSYPIQWMERKPDGGVVFRSVRAEEKEARRYNSIRQKAMEMLFMKIQVDFEKEEKGRTEPKRRRQTISDQDVARLEDGQDLYEAVGNDPAYLEAHLSEQQLETLRSYRHSLMEKKQAELQDRYRHALEEENTQMNCPKRDVTPVWRLSIADSMAHPSCVSQLNLWRPSSDLQALLKEGCRYKVYNLVTSDGKKRSSIETVQLTGTKKTQFQQLQVSQEWLSERFQPRVSTNFVNLQNPDFQPLCGEVDLTGCVISIIDGQGSSPAFYLADGQLNFVKVRCFSSLSLVGLEDVLKPRVLLALSNLQLRGQSMYPTPVVYAGDLTVFSTNPKEVHLQESFGHLKSVLQCQESFYLNAEEKLSDLVKSEGLSSISSPALKPQTPASATDRGQDSKTSVTFQKPVGNHGSFTPVNKNTSAVAPSTENDRKIQKRRRALDYLSRVPSPPPLSHLSSVASPCVNKTFNPPRRSGTPGTLKTAHTPAQKPSEATVEHELVNDEELAMIDTQALLVGDVS